MFICKSFLACSANFLSASVGYDWRLKTGCRGSGKYFSQHFFPKIGVQALLKRDRRVKANTAAYSAAATIKRLAGMLTCIMTAGIKGPVMLPMAVCFSVYNYLVLRINQRLCVIALYDPVRAVQGGRFIIGHVAPSFFVLPPLFGLIVL